MRTLGFALLLLLWVVLVYAGYVLFGWWMVAFATLGALWAWFRLKSRRDAAARACGRHSGSGG
jgi:hypothetical protein